MRITVTLASALLLLMSLVAPALAGDAESPEITDPCGQRGVTDPQYVLPQNDICAAWFTSDVTGAAPLITATVRTLEPTDDDARVVRVGWTSGTCRWEVTVDDAVASPRPTSIPIGENGAVFPYQYPVALRVSCELVTEPCVPEVPVICTSSSYQREGYAELPAEAVAIDGTDVAVSLDLSLLELSGDEVDGETISPGDTLTDLEVAVSTTPTRLFAPAGPIVSVSGIFSPAPYGDRAVGDAYTLPVEEE